MKKLYDTMCENILKSVEINEFINSINNYIFIGNNIQHLYQSDIISPEKISFYFIWDQKNKQFRTIDGNIVDISYVKSKIINNYCVISHIFSRYLVSILSDVYNEKNNYHSNFIDITHKNWRGVNLLSSKIHKEHINDIQYTYNHLNDDESKKILCNSINFRMTRNPKILKTSSYKQYFHPKVYPFTDSIIIEGGVFNGNSAIEFFQKSEKKSIIYAYEPDFNNYLQALKNIINNNANSNIFLINNGLSDKRKLLNFSSNAQSSFANENGDEHIFCSSIDELVQKINIKPTHIKLDIEGEENNALLGAIQTIKTYKPKLLISVYHKPDDIWKILQTIQSFRGDYSFSLGFHSDAFTIYEIILYAY